MQFCDICSNMLYTHIDQSDRTELQFSCKNCNFKKTVKTSDNTESIAVVEKEFFNDHRASQQFKTKYVKYDMTLPRVRNIRCPNKCQEVLEDGTSTNSEVICQMYDRQNMRYLYYCCQCEQFWTLDSDNNVANDEV